VFPRVLLYLLACGLFTFATAQTEDAAARAKARQIEQDAETLKAHVFIKFSHFGDSLERSEDLVALITDPSTSLLKRKKADASAIWMRLHNNSRLPIKISTETLYIPPRNVEKCGYRTTKGHFFHGLCDGDEIAIRFAVIDAKGQSVPYSFNQRYVTMVPPNSSMVFDLPKGLLRKGRRIVIPYNFVTEDANGRLEIYGEPRELRLSQSNVP
jgi:hypothetical protein